jgi:hypothetical protein
VQLTETALALHGDPEALLRDMGLPEVVRQCFGHAQFGRDLARAFARADLLLHDGELKVLELNIDSGIGGMVGGSLFPQAYFNSPGGRTVRSQAALYADSPLLEAARFIRAIATTLDLGPRPFVAILEWDYDLEIQHTYASLLAQYGIPASFVHVETLEERDGFLYSQGRRIDLALKNFSMGSLDFPEQMGAIAAAVAKGGTPVLTDSRSVLSSNKRMLAVLSEHADRLNGLDRALIERHVPWSREVKDQAVSFQGETYRMQDLLAPSHRADFVLKRGSGEGGLSVVIGAHSTPSEWEEAVVEALKSRDFILQRYEAPDRIELPFFAETLDRVVWRRHPFVLGQFVIDGAPGGVLVRFDTSDDEGVINYARGAGIVTAVVEGGSSC